ncbi:MAG TPA: right-handed parallel beta-helix repeat-containing protein [Gaiellaceae bacterium]
MSYTLRGRLESRLTALVPVVIAAGLLALAQHRWWPVEAVALMLGVGLLLDLQVYRWLRYQPGWAAVPFGLVELAALIGLMHVAGIMAPLGQAIALFAGGWVVAQLLGHAAFPLLRLGYAEDGGELGRVGLVAALGVGVALAGAGATAYAQLPPVVHLAAGVHQGPLVISRREVLVGEPGAVVKGGIIVAANHVTIKNLSVVGGDNGITVDSHRGTKIENVSISGAKLDGIHVRFADVMIHNCQIDMLGNRLGQGIDISYTMGYMTMVDGCNVVGGSIGITTHVSMTEIANNHVSRTTNTAISMTEMSMGMVERNTVRGALGVGIYCNDRSMCEIEHNTVVDTKPDNANGDESRRGFGLLASFQSEADLRGNQLKDNPVPMGTVTESLIRATH